MDSLRSDVAAALESERDTMTRALGDLLSVPTENPPGLHYDDCVDLLEEMLRRNGLQSERIDITEDPAARRTVLTASYGVGDRTLYLHGHYDVVPAHTSSQFEPVIKGDAVFGRGASDMKSGLVAMIFALKALKRLDAPLLGKVTLVFVPDEETGGLRGSAVLAARGRLGVNGVGMFLPEPTSGVIWHAHRGALTLDVTVRGRAAHVGLAHRGVNAFERALPLISELFALKSELGDGAVLLVGGRVRAGTNFNVVPDMCSFSVDRRFNPDEDHETERRRLLDVFERAKASGIDAEVTVLQEGASSSTSAHSPVAMALAQSIENVTGKQASFETCPGLLELRFYTTRGVPALAYGPGLLEVSHGPNEFVKITRMIECAQVYALAAMQLLS